MRRKSKEDEKTSEELNSAHRCSQAKREYKPVTLNELNCCFCLCHTINILLTKLSQSIWENENLTTSVKILPYRPTKLG